MIFIDFNMEKFTVGQRFWIATFAFQTVVYRICISKIKFIPLHLYVISNLTVNSKLVENPRMIKKKSNKFPFNHIFEVEASCNFIIINIEYTRTNEQYP